MKKSFLCFVVLFITCSLFGREVSVEQAKVVATAFLQNNNAITLRSADAIHLNLVEDFFTKTPKTNVKLRSSKTESPEIYVFTINPTGGFIIVSGDDAAIPVLGYSTTERLDITRTLSENLRYWLEGYKQQIRSLRVSQVEPVEYIKNLWKGNSGTLRATQNTVLPLVKTLWDQSPYYNDLVPYDTDYQMRNSVGCVATAMAQIMKYWEYPSRGFGVHAYKHDKYGVLSADFGATNYDWASMPDSLTGTNYEIARLMYHCGISVNMDYDILGGSGSMILYSDASPDRLNAETALSTNFGYSPSIRGLYRKDYSDSAWQSLLKNEFDSGRPVLYGGSGTGYGHAFVCDGYDANNYFHMNWGWSGYYNGYFLIDALNPVTEYPFNLNQQALFGIRPKDPVLEAILELKGNVVTNKPTIDYGEGFTISSNIVNVGSLNFNGDYCAAIFDEKLLLVDTVDIKTGENLGSGNQNSQEISFTSKGLSSMVPGKYRAYILHRPTGRFWVPLSLHDGDSTSKAYSEIEVVNTNEIGLYSSMHLASAPAYANDTLSVWLNIENNSSTDFHGSLSLSLCTKEGAFVATIEEKTNLFLASNSHFADSLNFYNAHVPLIPGVYMLKLMHRRDGSTYELTGSSTKGLNPIKIDLLEPLPTPDIYEVNDSVEIAFPLPVTYVSNQARVTTPFSNIHNATDVDFYVLTLEPGYEYSVNAMLNDKMVSNDGKKYTVDGAFRYSTDGINWSDYFDDVSSGEIKISDDTLLYFKVGSTVAGDIGSYLLDIQINRRIKTSVKLLTGTEVTVYQNPFTDCVTVSCPEIIQEYFLFDMDGRLQRKAAVGATQAYFDLSEFEKGMYILKLVSGGKVYFNKLMK